MSAEKRELVLTLKILEEGILKWAPKSFNSLRYRAGF